MNRIKVILKNELPHLDDSVIEQLYNAILNHNKNETVYLLDKLEKEYMLSEKSIYKIIRTIKDVIKSSIRVRNIANKIKLKLSYYFHEEYVIRKTADLEEALINRDTKYLNDFIRMLNRNPIVLYKAVNTIIMRIRSNISQNVSKGFIKEFFYLEKMKIGNFLMSRKIIIKLITLYR